MTALRINSLSSSSTTTTTTTPANSTSNFQNFSKTSKLMLLNSIKRDYQSAIGKPMPAFIENEVLTGLNSGTPAAHYHYALKETAYAPMPSWRYTAAILRRLAVQGLDPEELME